MEDVVESIKSETVKVRSHLIGDFIIKIIAKVSEGYSFNEHHVYRLGREYVAELTLKEVFEAKIAAKEAQLVFVDECKEFEEVVHDATVVPDWPLLNKMVLHGDKDGLESYCRPFGIKLKKTKSIVNMMNDFKAHVGA